MVPVRNRNRIALLYEMFTQLILDRLTLAMTRVIIIITRMTGSHFKAEQEIKQRLLSVSRFCGLAATAFSFCLTPLNKQPLQIC